MQDDRQGVGEKDVGDNQCGHMSPLCRRGGVDTIAKTARRVRHASALLRVGLRGVDDERVKVIFVIFTYLLFLRENGSSRSSSTPSNPYGSRAEA